MTKPKDSHSSPSEKKSGSRVSQSQNSEMKTENKNGAAPKSAEKTAETGATLSKNKEIKKLLDMGVQRGFLTYVEVNELLPLEFISSESIDEIMNLLSENEIEVIDAAKRPKDAE